MKLAYLFKLSQEKQTNSYIIYSLKEREEKHEMSFFYEKIINKQIVRSRPNILTYATLKWMF